MNIKQIEKALSNNHWKVQKLLPKKVCILFFFTVFIYSNSPFQLFQAFIPDQPVQINELTLLL